MWNQVQETVSFIKEKTNFTPEYGVILGSRTGLITDLCPIKKWEDVNICVHEVSETTCGTNTWNSPYKNARYKVGIYVVKKFV